MEYKNDFGDKVRSLLMDSQLSEVQYCIKNALRTLNSGHGMLGRYLEKISNFRLSPEKVQELFTEEKVGEILQYAELSIACTGLFREWNELYREQKPIKRSCSFVAVH